VVREAATATFVRPMDWARSTGAANDVNAPPSPAAPPFPDTWQALLLYLLLPQQNPSLLHLLTQSPSSLYQTLSLDVDRHYYYSCCYYYYYHLLNSNTLHNRNHGQGKYSRAKIYPAGTPLTPA
jgi:hypothetical protein